MELYYGTQNFPGLHSFEAKYGEGLYYQRSCAFYPSNFNSTSDTANLGRGNHWRSGNLQTGKNKKGLADVWSKYKKVFESTYLGALYPIPSLFLSLFCPLQIFHVLDQVSTETRKHEVTALQNRIEGQFPGAEPHRKHITWLIRELTSEADGFQQRSARGSANRKKQRVDDGRVVQATT